MSEIQCETCKWWQVGAWDYGYYPGPSKNRGYCRAHPPRAIEKTKSVWPETFRTDFCGEHVPKTEPKEFVPDY